MKTNNPRILPIAYTTCAVVLGFAAGWLGQDLVHGNDDARDVIVTVFSILAGFLIAIMTLLGDQSVIPGSWRIAQEKRESIRAKLIRQKWLFYLYLVTLSLIFLDTLLKVRFPEVAVWLERAYFGFATTAFILSFKLPSTLMEVQTERIDAVIGARRASASTLDKN
ncbi:MULTISPECIES: hypothetical protein [unclassified Rhizobium]|uniref:hypothetical protein n=1 Tax=unclassified Rhizobium TaxID=2613769 RepID=UPI0006F4C211|nr:MULTISPECIES: hypothetical protein [unclassified Rhizobium]KQV39187.1 hypothetical protein ASC86_23250 [Rhizobium sp. Root1212]KRD35161.1 hypothetical protein ASE37_21820 [Rhizobium sp. Root268]